MDKELHELFREVDDLFPKIKEKEIADTFSFEIGRLRKGVWCFKVIDSWQSWRGRGFDIKFYGDTLPEAITKFLDYVRTKNIAVDNLMEKIKSV